MPFSKFVPLSCLIRLITCKVPARWVRLVCLVVFFAVVLSALPIHPKHDGVNAQTSRTGLTQGPPSHNLLNLDETYANVASGRTLKGYGRSGPAALATQSVTTVTVHPTAYQTPNGPGTWSISASNTGGSGSISVTASSGTATSRWYGFPNVPGQIIGVRLKMSWSASGSLNGPTGGGGGFSLSYTGGSVANLGGSSFSQSSSFDVALPNNQDLTQIQVTFSLNGGAGPNTTFSANASVWDIRIEVQVANCFANVPADRWRGEYFNNQTLSGSPAMVSDDSISGTEFLNRNFGGASPGSVCGVIADNFSARWTRTVNFAQGIYRFSAIVDNGVRLYVDGVLWIDWWGNFMPNTYRADVFLSAGAHEIKLELIEYVGDARASLSWTAVEGASGNMAFGKLATQSSTYVASTADLAVDGHTNGDYAANSLAITNLEHQPWWQVDLGSVRQIGAVILRNRTDCCGDRLSNFYVLVSDNPFASADLTTTINQAGVSSFYTADPVGISKEIGVYRSGRYVRVQLAGDNHLQLAEVEVKGGANRSMALSRTVSQSSTGWGADAFRAVDSNTSGNWNDNSLSHTNFEHQPWWQVDLGGVRQIGTLILWNRTDCCGSRLSNFYVLVSDNPFNSTNLTATINQSGVSSYYTADPVGTSKEIAVYRSGRYVRVQLAGDDYLQLAEVEVRGGADKSLAFGKTVSQSSTALGADASRAVDSNTNGNWNDNSVTHTNFEHQPWWQVDLGSVQQIGAVILWNRTDGGSDRLSNFYVLVSDAPFNSTDLTATINQSGVSNYYTADPVGEAKEIGVYRSGRYVRVQLAGDNYLHLAEVEVRNGASLSGCVASVPVNRWKGEYFNNTTLMGSPAMVQDNGSGFLNFDFGTGSPGAACGLSAEYFSARWTRTVNFPEGTYRFSVTGDDGVRLFVGGELKIDKWILQGPTTYTADVTLSAGSHDIRLEFFDATVYAVAILSWRLLPIPDCVQNAPLIGAAPRTGAGESVATTPASEAPKRCGQKSSD